MGKCYTVILKKSPINITSPIYFKVSRCENGKCKAHQTTVLETLKPVEVHIYSRPRTIHIGKQILILSRDPVPVTYRDSLMRLNSCSTGRGPMQLNQTKITANVGHSALGGGGGGESSDSHKKRKKCTFRTVKNGQSVKKFR
jgi:hypothetical protein